MLVLFVWAPVLDCALDNLGLVLCAHVTVVVVVVVVGLQVWVRRDGV